MTAFYTWAMRNASMILFIAALCMIVAGTLPVLLLSKLAGHEPYGQSAGMPGILALQGFFRGIESAVWPLVGAAAIWRFDWKSGRKIEAAE